MKILAYPWLSPLLTSWGTGNEFKQQRCTCRVHVSLSLKEWKAIKTEYHKIWFARGTGSVTSSEKWRECRMSQPSSTLSSPLVTIIY